MPKRNPGTGAPDPKKDRSSHEAARGKKVSLQDIPRQLPSDHDLKHYFEHIQKESDRGAATMAAALLERALEDAIRKRLHDPGDGTADTWFEGINAPFRTFSAKISLGRALAIYPAEIEGHLIVIKNIRNAFAHGMIPIDFSHPALRRECLKLRARQIPEKEWIVPMKDTFANSCIVLARLLGMAEAAQVHVDEINAALERFKK
jgi:hypothetical protein